MKVSAFGLYSYGKSAPNGRAFEQFNSNVSSLFERLGIKPTYIGVDGEGYAVDYKKLGSRTHQKLLNSKFKGINSLSITANPEGSGEPSYDGFATVSLGFLELTQETSLSFTVNESIVRFSSSEYDDAWKSFLGLNVWDFGYGFSEQAEKQPECFLLGADSGKLTAFEQAALNAWYGSSPNERLERLRDIYPYNFVSTLQLERKVLGEVTLREFIEEQKCGLLIPLSEHGLYLWRIDESIVDQVRTHLSAGTMLISA